VEAFERAIAEYLGVPYAVAVSSATTGLSLALSAVGVLPGHEVITSPFTFIATVEAIHQAGATPVFADIDPATLNLSANSVARAVGRRTAAVIPVDIAGQPADYAALGAECRSNALLLVSDSAHAFGATYRRQPLAAWTDATVYSFYATKNLTAGEGGMVVTRRKRSADRVRLLSQHGMTATAHQRRSTMKATYDVVAAGAKGNLSEIHAAVGLGQLAVFNYEQQQRRKLVRHYRRNLSHLTGEVTLPCVSAGAESSWHLLIVRLNRRRLTIGRDRFVELMAQRGIECGIHYRPVFQLSHYRRTLGLSARDFPIAAEAGRSVVSLPLHPRLRVSQVDYVCEVVENLLKRYRR
jgi:dTDP-4-amino-4,6-dideoxygalactose transaminase